MADDIDELDGCLTEFPSALEEINDKLQSRESEFFWPNELAVVDVTRTIGFLEGEGLYAFWSADLNPKRIIKSFRKIGATKAADLLAETRWSEPLIKNGDYDRRQEEFGDRRFSEFCRIESELFDAFKDVPPLALRFAEAKGVTGKPLGGFGRLVATVTFPFRVIIPAFLEGLREERRNPSIDPDSLPIVPQEAIAASEAKVCFGWVDDGWIRMELDFPVRYSGIESLEPDDGSSSMHFEWYVFPERSIAGLAGKSFDEEALSEHSIYDRGELKIGGRRIDCDIHRISFTQIDKDHLDLSLSVFCWFYNDELAQNATVEVATKATITTEYPEG